MAEKMRTLSVTDVGKLDLIMADRPSPRGDEVLIRVAYCGICGSDFPRYFNGGVHNFPQVLGHEFSGTVVELGDQVDKSLQGRRVAVAPLVPCQECEQCLQGYSALCTAYSFIGSRQQGALADYVAVPARNCIPIPDTMSLKEAALVEPASIALHALSLIEDIEQVDAAVLGSGVIGLIATMALKARGASSVTCIDISEEKLARAQRCGADHIVINRGDNLTEHYAKVDDPQLCIEIAGFPQTQRQAITICGRKGHVVLVGTGHGAVEFSNEEFETILRRELTIKGSWMSYSAPFPGQEWIDAVEMIASRRLNVEMLISNLYSLEDGPRPFIDSVESGGAMLKPLYEIGGEES